jgi:hypothetical protein
MGVSWPRLFEIILANHFHEDLLTYAAIISVWYALNYYHPLVQPTAGPVNLSPPMSSSPHMSYRP